MSNEKIFADGFSFQRNENAPDFVIGKVKIKMDQALPWLKQNASKDGWVNLDVKQSKGGKFYLELDQWQPKMSEKKNELKRQEVYESTDVNDDIVEELPF
tara:strand:+ start:1152 stop:1451 length:300 start_codon:yes stop_codon:yes gene_type:complete